MTHDETERTTDAAGPPEGEATPQPSTVLRNEPRPEAPPVPPRPGRLAPITALLAVVASAAVAGAVFLWWNAQRDAAGREQAAAGVESALAQVRTALENQASVLEQLARDDEQLGEAGEARGRELAGLDRRLRDAERRLDEVAGGSEAARRGLMRTEVEQYLRMANRATRLARDPETALAALHVAENRLRVLDDPALTGVRAELAAEIDALENLPRIDVDGIALRLGRLAARVEELPLETRPAGERLAGETAPAESGSWARGWAAIRGAFASLVSVRRSDEAVRPLLAPGQVFFLRQNLRLELEIARLAALRGDRPGFAQSLGNAREWLASYFDVNAPTVRTALETLDTLARAELAGELPDISGSLEALRRAGTDAPE